MPWRGPRCIRVGRYRWLVTTIADEWLSTTEPGLSVGSHLNFGCLALSVSVLDRDERFVLLGAHHATAGFLVG